MLLSILASVLGISLISFIGVITLSIRENILKKWLLVIVAFAAGTLLGAAFFDLIPETIHELGEEGMIYVLAGIMLFFIVERFIFWHHCHSHDHPHPVKPYTYLNLVGDGVHNFLDGAIIAAAYLTDISLGVVTTIAIALHEIPQEIGDFGILVHGGFKVKKALVFNFISALAAIAGAVITYFISTDAFLPYLVAVAGGGFVYIATADLFPELHDDNMWRLVLQTLVMIGGIVLIYFLTGTLKAH